MQLASARRTRPRRCPSSTSGSWGGSASVCIARHSNGGHGRGDRIHPPSRKLLRLPGVVLRVTTPPDPAAVRPSSRAYLVWGVGLLAYAVAVFHRSSLGVA